MSPPQLSWWAPVTLERQLFLLFRRKYPSRAKIMASL